MTTLRFLMALACFLAAMAAPGHAQFGGLQIASQFRHCPGTEPELSQVDFDASTCTDVLFNRIDPQGTRVWLQTQIDGSQLQDIEGPVSVLVYAMATSEIYWNGELIGQNGRTGTSAETEIAGRMDVEFHVPPHLIRSGENLLSIHMSSHRGWIHARRPVHLIALGPHRVVKPQALRYYLPTLIAAGALLLAIGYFGLSYLADRRNTASLLLALLAGFAIMQAWAESSRVFFDYLYPLHVPRLILVGVMSWCIAVTLTALVTVRFRIPNSRFYILAAAGIGLVVAPFIPGFDGKSLMALLIGMGVSLIAIAGPTWRGDRAAQVTAVALLGFIALIFYRSANLLDRDLFLAITALCGVLFVDNILATRRERRAREEADRRSARLELELVRRGIAPHFLMNTLNSLAEWVESDPKTGVRMIHALGDQMRGLAGISDRDLIPLAEEIDLVRSYLAVMSFRTDAPFELRVDNFPPGVKVPPGILHTLAENAFSHNRYPRGGEFHLSIDDQGGRFLLTFDTPIPHSRRSKESQGQGHAYVRGRLLEAFGPQADFHAYVVDTGAWRTRIELPG